MDPDETLAQIIEICENGTEAERGDIAELVEALDGWLRKGGFFPKRWDKAARKLK